MKNYFASNLKHLRIQAGLTQEELAKKLNKDYSTIGKWELGQRSPIMGDVFRVSELFNIPLEQLIGENITSNGNLSNEKDEIQKLFDKAKPHLSKDDEETIKFIMNKTIRNYEENKKE